MNEYFKKRCLGFRLMLRPEADNVAFLERCCVNDIGNDHDFIPVVSSAFARVYSFAFNGESYFYKKYFFRNVFEPIKNFFRGDRAIRALKGDNLLIKNGFNAPKCMMVGKKGRNIFKVSEAIKGGKDLTGFVAEEFFEGMNRSKTREKRSLCKLLGKQIGKLHAAGIIHGDLRWGNVMIVKSSVMPIQIWYLDNERTLGYSSIPPKMRIFNLVQMNMISSSVITSTDRMRFYTAYLAENPCLMSQKWDLAQKILQKTAIRFARKALRKKGGVYLNVVDNRPAKGSLL
jgi:tRNA A-37 threonylcarbamoyl transferase component Bud32